MSNFWGEEKCRKKINSKPVATWNCCAETKNTHTKICNLKSKKDRVNVNVMPVQQPYFRDNNTERKREREE